MRGALASIALYGHRHNYTCIRELRKNAFNFIQFAVKQ